jgi:hypothetical protein
MYFIIREGEIHAGPFDSADQCVTYDAQVFDKVVSSESGIVMFERDIYGWFEMRPLCHIGESLLEEMRSHVLAHEKANAMSHFNGADLMAQEFIDEAKRSQAADMVNSPPHYNQAGIECIYAIAAATSGKTGIEAVCVANVIKYLWRYELKNGVEDVKKARWYLDRLIGELEK